MKIVAISLLSFAMMGLLVPSALGEKYVNQGDYPFSIEYPSEWEIILKEDVSVGVVVLADDRGHNGMFVSLWKDSVESDVADYEIWETLKEISRDYCYSMTMKESFATCRNYKITDSQIHFVDGYRTFTVFEEYVINSSGNDPLLANDIQETFHANGTYSVVFVGDDFWEIGTGWKSDNYEKAKALDIIKSLKLKDVENKPIPQPQPKSWFDGILDFFKSLFG